MFRTARLIAVSAAVSLVTLAVAASAVAAPACDPTVTTGKRTWTGAVNSDWFNPGNWSGSAIPTSTTHVCIPEGAGTVLINGGGSAAAADIESSRAIWVLNSSSITISGTEASFVHDTFRLSSGKLDGGDALTIDGGNGLVWDGPAQMQGAGATTVAAGTPFSISDDVVGGTKVLGRNLTLNGTGAWTGETDVAMENGRTLQVGGMLDVQTDRLLYFDGLGSPPIFKAGGTLKKSAGTGIFKIAVAFENDGATTTIEGETELTAGSGVAGSSGTWTAGTDAVIAFTGGWHRLDGTTAKFLGAGVTQVKGGALTVVSGTATVDPGATLDLASGMIDGAGALSVDGTLALTGGITDLAGAGATTIAGTLTINDDYGPGGPTIRRNVNLTGIGTLSGQADVAMGDAATFTVTGVFNIASDRSLHYCCSGVPLVKVVAGGKLNKTGGTDAADVSVPLENDGTVTADSGRLSVSGGSGAGSSAGTWSADAGDEVAFTGGVHQIAGTAAQFRGTGRVAVDGGTVSQLAGSTLTVSATGTLELRAGTLDGAGNLTVNGLLKWSGDSSLDGTGTADVPGTLAIDSSFNGGTRRLTRSMTLSGTGSWKGAADVTVADNRVLTVNGTLTAESDRSMFVPCCDPDVSALKIGATGSVFKSAGAATTSFSIPVENDGLVQASVGHVDLLGGGFGTSTGNWAASSGALLQFTGGGYLLGGTPQLIGTGRVRVNGAQLTLDTGAAATVPAGKVLEVSAGTITGPGALDVPGKLLWDGDSTIAGAGALTVPGTLEIAGGSVGTRHLGRNSTLSGTGKWSGGANWSLVDSTTLSVSGTLSLATDRSMVAEGSAAQSLKIVAGGTVTKTSGTGRTIIGVPVTNNGTLSGSVGRIDLTGGLTNYDQPSATLTGGAYLLSGGARLVMPPGVLRHLSGAVTLDGPGADLLMSNGAPALNQLETIDVGGALTLRSGRGLSLSGALTNNGLLDLGKDTTLSTAGNYTQGAGGTLAARVEGTTPGTNVSRLFIGGGGTGALNGALKLKTTVLYTPEQVVVGLIEGTHSGTFSSTPGGKAFTVDYSRAGGIDLRTAEKPYVRLADRSTQEGDADHVENLTLTLSKKSSTPVVVTYSTVAGAAGLTNATSGSDYTPASSATVTFAPGETSKPLPITIKGDTVHEASERFTVTIASATNASLGDASSTVTILDNEGPISAYVNDVSRTEGNSGASNMAFTVSLSDTPAAGQTVKVNYAAADDTATAATADYQPKSGTLTFTNATGPTQTVNVAIVGDATPEGNEKLKLNLSAPVGLVIGDSSGAGTIVEDDGGAASPVLPFVTVKNAIKQEGASGTANMQFTLALSAPAANDVTVNYQTVDGAAKAPGDYTASGPQVATIVAGTLATAVQVPIVGDVFHEPSEALTLSLTGVSANATLADASANGTILDEEGAFSVGISDVGILEGDSGTKAAAFVVTLSAPPAVGETATVKYVTANGTAVAPGDYTAKATTTLTFTNATGANRTVSVTTKGDTAVENNEAFTLGLNTPGSNVVIEDTAGSATLFDDD